MANKAPSNASSVPLADDTEDVSHLLSGGLIGDSQGLQ